MTGRGRGGRESGAWLVGVVIIDIVVMIYVMAMILAFWYRSWIMDLVCYSLPDPS